MTQVTKRSDGLVSVAETPGTWTYLRRTWGMRDFVVAVSGGNVKAEFEHSLLGSLWLLINPLIMAAIYFLVFGVLFSARRSVPNYTAFLIVGLLVYTFTSRATTSATRSLRQNANIIQSVRFPRAVIPVSTTITTLITHIPALLVITGVALATGEGIGWEWLTLPVALLLQTAFNLGLALVAARLGFQFADSEQIIPHILRLGMYLSGVMYGVELIDGRAPDWLVTAFTANPMWVYMGLFRWIFIDGSAGPNWVAAGLYAVVSLLLGVAFFRGKELGYGHV